MPRKGFNFYRSYFDVYNELPDKDKNKFIEALLNKQFYGIEPTDLEGMARFAYLSQKHNIDSQVEGYENKTRTTLSKESEGGSGGGHEGGSVQEEEKGEEKEEVQYVDNEKVLRIKSTYQDNVLRILNINLKEYLRQLDLFCLSNDMTRAEKELKKHFGNWIKQQPVKTIKKVSSIDRSTFFD